MNGLIKLTLCQNGCCPTVEYLENDVIIKDDFGGKVTLTHKRKNNIWHNTLALQKQHTAYIFKFGQEFFGLTDSLYNVNEIVIQSQQNDNTCNL
jgi:hypothetical protein